MVVVVERKEDCGYEKDLLKDYESSHQKARQMSLHSLSDDTMNDVSLIHHPEKIRSPQKICHQN